MSVSGTKLRVALIYGGRSGEHDCAIGEFGVVRIKTLKNACKRGAQFGFIVLGGGGERGAE